MFCQKCGKELKENAKFCNYCGTSVSGEKPAQMTQEVQDESLGSKITSHIDKKVKMLVIELIAVIVVLGLTLIIGKIAVHFI